MVLKNLQALRGVAAGIVFLIHLMSTKHGLGVDWLLLKFWWIGPAGVDLFFVISGFIVCLTASRSGMLAKDAGWTAFNFAAKRFFRIYPVYWVVLAFSFVLANRVELSPPSMPEEKVWRVVSLMTTNNDKVMLAWTLAYEVFFYGVLALAIWMAPRHVFRIVGFWVLASLAAVGIATSLGVGYFKYVPLNPLILEFCAGCVIAYVVEKGWRSAGWSTLLSGAVLFVLACWVHSQIGNWQSWYRAPIFIIPCALIVYGAVAIELNGGWTFPRWLQRLGDSSYSLYIWHQLVLAVLLKVFEKFGLLDRLEGPFILLIWGVLAIAAGFVSYYMLEKPMQRWAGKTFVYPGRSGRDRVLGKSQA